MRSGKRKPWQEPTRRSDGQFLDQAALRDHTRVGLGQVETSAIVRVSGSTGKPTLRIASLRVRLWCRE